MINKKGLTDKEIQELINKDLEFSEYYKKFWLPMYVQTETMKIICESLKEVTKSNSPKD